MAKPTNAGAESEERELISTQRMSISEALWWWAAALLFGLWLGFGYDLIVSVLWLPPWTWLERPAWRAAVLVGLILGAVVLYFFRQLKREAYGAAEISVGMALAWTALGKLATGGLGAAWQPLAAAVIFLVRGIDNARFVIVEPFDAPGRGSLYIGFPWPINRVYVWLVQRARRRRLNRDTVLVRGCDDTGQERYVAVPSERIAKDPKEDD